MTIKQNPVSDLKAWQYTNPLRKHLGTTGIKQLAAATILGVAPITVRSWMDGFAQPSHKHRHTIARFMGLRPKAMDAEWDKWLGQKP